MGNALPNFNSDRDPLYMDAYVPRRVSQTQPQRVRTRLTLYGDFSRELHCPCILREEYQKFVLFSVH